MQHLAQALPTLMCVFGMLTEHLLQVYVDETGRVFCTLQIAAHPIQIIGNS
jgi:hypothetical protein